MYENTRGEGFVTRLKEEFLLARMFYHPVIMMHIILRHKSKTID